MADNYLENHYEEYLKRKAEWEKKKKKQKKITPQAPVRHKPDGNAQA